MTGVTIDSVKKSFILIVLGILLYSFSLFNGFVWDDEVMHNAQLSASQAYFRPAMTVVNEALFTLFDAQPFFFHLLSVAFHIATAILLFYLLKQFFKVNVAFFLSLVFLVHPSNVEAVSFISALQEVLFSFTGTAGLYLLVRSKKISIISIFGAIILCGVALLMKETAVVFFALIFCYLFLFHRKDTSAIQLYVAFAIIALFTYGMARFTNGHGYVQGQGLFPIMRVPFVIRLINIPMIILYYGEKLFFPLNLGIAQHWVVRSPGFFSFFLPVSIELLLFLAAVIYCVKTKNKIFIFFFLWFLIGLLPHLQIIPLNMTVAERWMYFPMIGLLGMIGTILSKFKITNLKFKIAGVVIISLLFIRSFSRTLDWRSGLSLYSRDIRKDSSFDLQNNMGVELFRVGKYSEAKKYFEISTQLAPYWWVNWNNLGAAYEQERNFAKAQECYEKAIHNGRYSLAYENLAKILVLYGKDKKKASEFVKKALQLFPESETLQIVNSKE